MTRPLDGGIKTTDRTASQQPEHIVRRTAKPVKYCGKCGHHLILLVSIEAGYCRGCKPQYIPEHTRINRKSKREPVNE